MKNITLLALIIAILSMNIQTSCGDRESTRELSYLEAAQRGVPIEDTWEKVAAEKDDDKPPAADDKKAYAKDAEAVTAPIPGWGAYLAATAWGILGCAAEPAKSTFTDDERAEKRREKNKAAHERKKARKARQRRAKA